MVSTSFFIIGLFLYPSPILAKNTTDNKTDTTGFSQNNSKKFGKPCIKNAEEQHGRQI
jgi:hypothetical protein